MLDIPVRLAVRGTLEKGRTSVRPMVRDAHPAVLSIDERAIEILSSLSGKTLRGPQRGILAGTLKDLLGNAEPAPGGTGPLADADVLGAILGIVHFVLQKPGDWLIARIPEGGAKSADVLALSAAEQPWLLELKAVAPMSAEVDQRASLDTCTRIGGQRCAGLTQLDGPGGTQAVSGSPAVAIGAPKGVLRGGSLGGRALSVSVLPDAALVGRTDVPAVGKRGCPPGKRCIDQCLSGKHGKSPACIVGLLWSEVDASASPVSPEGPVDVLENVAVAIQGVSAGSWSGSVSVADVALGEFSESAAELAGRVGPDPTAALGLRLLHASRNVTSVDTRSLVASRLKELGGVDLQVLGRVDAEVPAGLERRPDPRSLSTVLGGFREVPDSELLQGEVRFEDGDGVWFGTFVSGMLRLAPQVDLVRRAVSERRPANRLKSASRALEQHLLPMFLDLKRDGNVPVLSLSDVKVSLGGDGSSWTVGRGLPRNECAWRWLQAPRRLDVTARREYRNAVSKCLRAGDWMELAKWFHAHRVDLSRAYPDVFDDVVPHHIEHWFHYWHMIGPHPRYRPMMWPPWPFEFDDDLGCAGSPSSTWAAIDGTIQASTRLIV